MPIIEGIGDEVFHVLMVVLVVVLGIVGWWSTSISDQPLIRTILILEPRHRHHTTTENTSSPTTASVPQDTGQPDPIPSSEVQTETAAVPDTSSGASKNETGQGTPEQPQAIGSTSNLSPETGESSGSPLIPNTNIASSEIAYSTDTFSDISATGNELRIRRLQFFGDRQGFDNAINVSSNHPNGVGTEPTSSTNIDQESPDERQPEPATESESQSSDPCQACDDIRIKLKFLNDNQKLVQGKLQEPLGDFKRRNFAVEIAAHKVIRLIFNGQVLQSDERTLHNYGLFDNCVVHCLVRNQRTTNPNVENATTSNGGEDLQLGGVDIGDTREWDMSNILYISMFVILSAIWYLRINFAQLFSATSTVALFGLSGIFVIFLVGMYIPDQEVIRT